MVDSHQPQSFSHIRTSAITSDRHQILTKKPVLFQPFLFLILFNYLTSDKDAFMNTEFVICLKNNPSILQILDSKVLQRESPSAENVYFLILLRCMILSFK